MAERPIQAYREQVELKYQVYNGLFLKLPFPPLGEVGIQLPVFADLCQRRLLEGENPRDIVEEFLRDYRPPEGNEDRFAVLFLFAQLVERQVVLFDALEDAAYPVTTPLDGPGSLTSLQERAREVGAEEGLRRALNGYKTRIVLTAHPTQFYPEPVLGIIQDLSASLSVNDICEIEQLLLQMGKTSFRNAKAPTPLTEAQSLLRSHAATFYEVMTDIQVRLGVDAPVLELGFWPGGDRDGNPFVTADVTREVGALLRQTAHELHMGQIKKLRRRLTFKGVMEAMANWEQLSLDDLIHQVEALRERLYADHQGLFVSHVERLLASLRLFGFHFASLDLRQDSRVHSELIATQIDGYEALSEDQRIDKLAQLLDDPGPLLIHDSDAVQSLTAAAQIQQSNGKRGCHRYIISNAKKASHVLEVLALAHWSDCLDVDIVPLFESIDALQESDQIMSKLLGSEAYRGHLDRRGKRQTIMVGFSDGTKDGGYLACNWEIFRAKERLADLCQKHGVEVIYFDGRGGPAARGGGNTHRFYRVMGYHVPQAEVQLTVQGQTISSKFGTPESAQHNIEQLMTAGLEYRLLPRPGELFDGEARALLQELSDLSLAAYRELREHQQFLPYLERCTPLAVFGKLNIASRPPRRDKNGQLKLEDLRAIPFVGSWSLIKQNVPGYYGLGAAVDSVIASGREEQLRALYQQSLFVRTLFDNASQALLKSYIPLTAYLKHSSEFGEVWQMIADETARTERAILRISGVKLLMEADPINRASILLREQLILPLLVIQQFALQGSKEASSPETYTKLLMKSIPPIVNASRNSA